MLAKPYRLPSREKFSTTNCFSNIFFRILSKSNNLSSNRFGFVIGKKVDKRAVVRNRLRRVLSESVREFISGNEHKDVLFIVKKSFVDESTESFQKTIHTVLRKIL